jgi:hypothetical protein
VASCLGISCRSAAVCFSPEFFSKCVASIFPLQPSIFYNFLGHHPFVMGI